MKRAEEFQADIKRLRFETALAARIKSLFVRCPSLCGFAVLERGTLPQGLEAAPLEGDLFVTDIGVYPRVSPEASEEVCDEITVALLDFMYDRPEARELLAGRTFARTLQ